MPDNGDDDLERRVHALVDEYRASWLWFLPPDYYPTNVAERIRVLQYIERYGDVSANAGPPNYENGSHPSSSATPVGS